VSTLVPRERLIVAPSCSLLHVPYDVTREEKIVPEVRHWLAFAEQKLAEVVLLGRALHEGRAAVAGELAESSSVTRSRATSALAHDALVQGKLTTYQATERLPYTERRPIQAEHLQLPVLPTTTIGSFPQTS